MFSQRRNVLSKEARAKLSKWANRPPTDNKDGISERQRNLWIALNEFVMERGGQITSVLYANPVRLEVPPESELPAKLRELGYDPVYCEQTTRIGAPVSTKRGRWTNLNNGYSFHTRDVYELRLPK
jgi:hypothetical protein